MPTTMGKLFRRPELEAAVAAHPKVFREKLRGMNQPLVRAMRPYALEADYSYSLSEFKTFAADPRPLAEVNLSVDWVTKFGLKVEQCDTNDDGMISPNERKPRAGIATATADDSRGKK